MRNSERVLEAIKWKIQQNATALDCLQDLSGVMVRVSFNKKTGKLKKCFLSPDSETDYEEK